MSDQAAKVTIGGPIAKADDAEQNVYGWAMVANKLDGSPLVDLQGDTITPDDLEKSVTDFMLEWRESGDQHDGQPPTGRVIESMVFTAEKMAKMGIPPNTLPEGWWLGVHIDKRDVYDAVVAGERRAFSIEGTAIREPM